MGVERQRPSRREVVKGAAAVAAALPASLPTRVLAEAPAAEAITPQLLEAAKKEGKVSFYTAMDIPVAERLAKTFEARFSGVGVRVERSGSERIYQRIEQERSSNIFAVDVVNSADAAHFIVWKRNAWLAAYVPEEAARQFPAEYRDADGMHITTRIWLSSLGYNTNLVKAEDAPKSYADLLDPKWTGRIIKAHPAYAGSIMTATFQIARELGWGYFEALAKQKILQVQSSTDPPKKLALGERAIMADGGEYVALALKEKGDPIEIVYPAEGTPLIVGPNGIFKNAPNPNAAKLFQAFSFSPECQQLIIDVGGLRSIHPQVKEHAGRRPLKDIKLMKDDAAAVEKTSEEIKARYTKIFRV